MDATKLDQFTKAYIDCALWSSTDDNDEPLDAGNHELSNETITSMIQDCKSFQEDNETVLAYWYVECGESEDRAGHDFWLTRNGHGAGFWDRWNSATDEGKIGKALTDASHTYESCDLYLGDDDLIYCA
jgi:hypothetical protein